MGTSRLFMPLLAELGGLGDGFCYKYVAPNGAPALERRLFNKATSSLCGKRTSRSAALWFQPRMLSGLGTQAEGLCSGCLC